MNDDITVVNECIHPDITLDKLRAEPYTLPAGYEWDTINIDDPLVVS